VDLLHFPPVFIFSSKLCIPWTCFPSFGFYLYSLHFLPLAFLLSVSGASSSGFFQGQGRPCNIAATSSSGLNLFFEATYPQAFLLRSFTSEGFLFLYNKLATCSRNLSNCGTFLCFTSEGFLFLYNKLVTCSRNLANCGTFHLALLPLVFRCGELPFATTPCFSSFGSSNLWPLISNPSFTTLSIRRFSDP